MSSAASSTPSLAASSAPRASMASAASRARPSAASPACPAAPSRAAPAASSTSSRTVPRSSLQPSQTPSAAASPIASIPPKPDLFMRPLLRATFAHPEQCGPYHDQECHQGEDPEESLEHRGGRDRAGKDRPQHAEAPVGADPRQVGGQGEQEERHQAGGVVGHLPSLLEQVDQA